VSNGLNLTITYRDRDGMPIDVKSLEQGTDIVAQITVSNPTRRGYEELAMTYIAPSGWEIANPRFEGWSRDAATGFEYQDIRDDRVHTYFDLGSGRSKTLSLMLTASYLRALLPAAVASRGDVRRQHQRGGAGAVDRGRGADAPGGVVWPVDPSALAAAARGGSPGHPHGCGSSHAPLPAGLLAGRDRRDGVLLGALLSSDESWRFPPMGAVPGKFEKALLAFEDKRVLPARRRRPAGAGTGTLAGCHDGQDRERRQHHHDAGGPPGAGTGTPWSASQRPGDPDRGQARARPYQARDPASVCLQRPVRRERGGAGGGRVAVLRAPARRLVLG